MEETAKKIAEKSDRTAEIAAAFVAGVKFGEHMAEKKEDKE